MRSIAALVSEYPEKTGREILEIQEQDKIKDAEEYERINKKRLAFVDDLNNNGGFFRGRFGVDQRYYYNITNARLMASGSIFFDIETIVVFLGHKQGVVGEGEIKVEKRPKNFCNADKYSLSNEERVTEKEWNEVNDYLLAVEKFWPTKQE